MVRKEGVSTMKKERIQRMIQDLQGLQSLGTLEACRMYHASEATIRRYFQELADSGLAVREHGGIRLPATNQTPSVPFSLRDSWNTEEKRLLARKASQLVQPGQTVMIYGGTTTKSLADFLNEGRIITNFPELCRIFRTRFPAGGGPQVLLTGGELNYLTGLLTGPAVRRSMENYRCDIGFSSAFGVDGEGLLDISDECCEEISVMLEKSAVRVILADHTKFGRRSFCRCMPWRKIHVLITTFDPENHPVLKEIRAKGVKVIFADRKERETEPRSAISG